MNDKLCISYADFIEHSNTRDLIIKGLKNHIKSRLEADASSIVYLNEINIEINDKLYGVHFTLLTTILKTIVNRNYVMGMNNDKPYMSFILPCDNKELFYDACDYSLHFNKYFNEDKFKNNYNHL